MRNPSWFNASNISELENEIFSIHVPVTTEVERMQAILDTNYAPADIDAIATECKHLTEKEQQLLHNLLTKYEHLFDGTLEIWNTDPIDIELKEPDCKPYHAKPYPVPDSQEQKLREEVNCLVVDLKVLRKNQSF
jgi:hypothetical protein